jgi:hypothetical protein
VRLEGLGKLKNNGINIAFMAGNNVNCGRGLKLNVLNILHYTVKRNVKNAYIKYVFA